MNIPLKNGTQTNGVRCVPEFVCIISAPERPPPPVVGKVTHHNIELTWDEALAALNTQNGKKGDSRIRVTIQEEDKTGSWGNVYT